MKNILLLVHDDDGQEARLQAALDIARALEGHLSCIDVALLPLISADMHGGTAQAMLLDEERAREGKNRRALEARLANEGISWDWMDMVGSLAESMLDASILADLIVLNRKLDSTSYPDMRSVTGDIVMHGRAPVVAVPENQAGFRTARALIAWDGGESCAATIRASVELLRLASDIRIFTASDRTTPVPPSAAAKYLSRHGIHSTVEVIERGAHDADKLITSHAESWKADYVLMGAYGRGRLREAFGGVTKRMLGTSKMPLVLGH